jgi:orotidine-5'-phosphate decarboxylase
MTTTTSRDRLAIALDTGDMARSTDLATAVAPFFGVAKVGLRLFAAEGPKAVETIRATGVDVFLDLKLHDIPQTVQTAALEVGRLGARYLTVHACGGQAMMAAAVEGLAEGAGTAGLTPPTILAVTVLTSDETATAETLTERVASARAAGVTGLVCAAPDLPTVRPLAEGMTVVTPGIRLPGGDAHDQKRIATPTQAIADGADVLVVGRAVSGADDPAATAEAIAASIDPSPNGG